MFWTCLRFTCLIWIFQSVKLLRNGAIPPRKKVVVEGINLIPVFLLSAPAYPVLPLYMVAKIYDKNSSAENYLVDISIMNSFGTLKARFRCLQHMDSDALPDLVPFVQLKKLEKFQWRNVFTFSEVAGFSITSLRYTSIVTKKGKNFKTEPCISPELTITVWNKQFIIQMSFKWIESRRYS